jgi:UDPglucose--hexose-1-phosphate uridylyltransferase
MAAGAGQKRVVWKNAGKLADGREIIYFDESPGLSRDSVPDGRDLPARSATAPDGLRFDPLLGEWVAIAEHRQDRTFLPAAGSCPLCPSRPGAATEIPAPSYDVVVFENRFPVFSGGPADPHAPAADGELLTGHGIGARRAATGRCEVVCFTPEHDASFASLDARRAGTVIAAWADRTEVLGGMPEIEHVFCFENRGEEVGATLQHPHGQIYGLPFVPPRTRQLLASARAYRASSGANLFDDMVAAELADGRRIVDRNEHWTAFVPEAAHWPFEVLLFPAVRVPDLAALSQPARDGLAEVYPAVLRRLDRLFGAPMPYLAVWQQAPASDTAAHAELAGHELGGHELGGHELARYELALYLQIMAVRRAPGKLKFMASTESGAGVWSNDVPPETAARMLRQAG